MSDTSHSSMLDKSSREHAVIQGSLLCGSVTNVRGIAGSFPQQIEASSGYLGTCSSISQGVAGTGMSQTVNSGMQQVNERVQV